MEKKDASSRVIEKGPPGHAVIKCGFCRGKGLDPFGLLFPGSKCQVCSGKGRVVVREPIQLCHYCKGTGVYPSSRNTCDVCMGKGVMTLPEGSTPCPECRGDSEDHATGMPCSFCHGKGVIAV